MILKLNYTEKRRNLSFYENMWFKKEFHRYQFYSKKQFGLFQLQQFIFCSFRVLYKWVGELIFLVLCCFFNIQFGLAFSWLLLLLIQTGFWISFKRFWFQLFFFFCLGFLSQAFTNHRTAGEGGGNFFNSSLPLPPASQVLRHQPGDCCRGLTSAHSQQPDLNREPLISQRKSLTTNLHALKKSVKE